MLDESVSSSVIDALINFCNRLKDEPIDKNLDASRNELEFKIISKKSNELILKIKEDSCTNQDLNDTTTTIIWSAVLDILNNLQLVNISENNNEHVDYDDFVNRLPSHLQRLFGALFCTCEYMLDIEPSNHSLVIPALKNIFKDRYGHIICDLFINYRSLFSYSYMFLRRIGKFNKVPSEKLQQLFRTTLSSTQSPPAVLIHSSSSQQSTHVLSASSSETKLLSPMQNTGTIVNFQNQDSPTEWDDVVDSLAFDPEPHVVPTADSRRRSFTTAAVVPKPRSSLVVRMHSGDAGSGSGPQLQRQGSATGLGPRVSFSDDRGSPLAVPGVFSTASSPRLDLVQSISRISAQNLAAMDTTEDHQQLEPSRQQQQQHGSSWRNSDRTQHAATAGNNNRKPSLVMEDLEDDFDVVDDFDDYDQEGFSMDESPPKRRSNPPPPPPPPPRNDDHAQKAPVVVPVKPLGEQVNARERESSVGRSGLGWGGGRATVVQVSRASPLTVEPPVPNTNITSASTNSTPSVVVLAPQSHLKRTASAEEGEEGKNRPPQSAASIHAVIVVPASTSVPTVQVTAGRSSSATASRYAEMLPSPRQQEDVPESPGPSAAASGEEAGTSQRSTHEQPRHERELVSPEQAPAGVSTGVQSAAATEERVLVPRPRRSALSPARLSEDQESEEARIYPKRVDSSRSDIGSPLSPSSRGFTAGASSVGGSRRMVPAGLKKMVSSLSSRTRPPLAGTGTGTGSMADGALLSSIALDRSVLVQPKTRTDFALETNAVMEGWMEKQSENTGFWQKRYYVLHETHEGLWNLKIYGTAVEAAWGIVPLQLKYVIPVHLFSAVETVTLKASKGRDFTIHMNKQLQQQQTSKSGGGGVVGSPEAPARQQDHIETRSIASEDSHDDHGMWSGKATKLKLRAPDAETRLLWVTLLIRAKKLAADTMPTSPGAQ